MTLETCRGTQFYVIYIKIVYQVGINKGMPNGFAWSFILVNVTYENALTHSSFRQNLDNSDRSEWVHFRSMQVCSVFFAAKNLICVSLRENQARLICQIHLFVYSKTCLKWNLKGPEHFSAKARFPFNQGTLHTV